MPLTFEWDPSLDHRLRDGLRALWADVAEAGGADGLAAPVSAEDLRADLLNHLAAVDAGSTRMLIGRDERGAVAASAFLAFNAHRPKRHWCSVYTVMVHPALQGRGYGRELMSAVEQGARGIDGITALRISCRGGLGLERFYGGCGYREVGRLPDAIRVTDDDFRDDVTLWLPLVPGGALARSGHCV